jgi:hypothetical protein
MPTHPMQKLPSALMMLALLGSSLMPQAEAANINPGGV